MDQSLHSRDWHHLLEYDVLQFHQHSRSSFDVLLRTAVVKYESLQLRHGTPGVQLMSDLVDQPHLVDVEQDSEAADDWLRSIAGRDDISVEAIGFNADTLSSNSPPTSLLDLYEYLCLLYVGPLGPRLPDRSRVNREKLVREVVADAFLGNLILRPGSRAVVDIADAGEAQPELATEMRSSPPQPQSEDESQPASSSSRPPSSQNPLVEEEELVRRLRAYATFRQPVLPLFASHNVLAHIPDSIEEDPRDYSYQSVNQKLKLAQEETAAMSLDPRERRKAERQAARLQRKLEQKAKLSQEVMRQRAMLPSVSISTTSLGRGMMNLPGREVQSSQAVAIQASSQGPSQSQAGIPMLNMTQPERGVYGTRSLKLKGKGKGSKSKPGF